MSSIPNKADQAKKGLNDPFAKRDLNKPSSAANPASNQKANLNTKQKINMLNSRQKLAEQLLSGETEQEAPKTSEQTAEKKAPPKFKRPGMKSENEPSTEKKPKVNLDDLLDNYEKHELPEADLNKISNQNITSEAQNEPYKAAAAGVEVEETIKDGAKQGLATGEAEQGQKSNFYGKEEYNDTYTTQLNRQSNLDLDFDSNEIKKHETSSKQLKANTASVNKERIDMVLNNEDYYEEHNTTSNMNLNPSENTFDDINLNNNHENTNTTKFKGIGSTTSINPKNAIFEEEISSSNNLFESTTSHTKNFFENLSTANNQNNQLNLNNVQSSSNNLNNNNNTLNYSGAVIHLGSERTLGTNQSNNNLMVVPNTNNNSEKDLLGVNTKQADNIDFHINPSHHENKSSNTNSENNHTSQGEDNLSIPEINCKSIELTNENFTTEKKNSANSSNMNLNNQSNGNYQDIKEFSSEANNFFSNFKDENATANKFNKNPNSHIKAMTVTNSDETGKRENQGKSTKNLKDFSENFTDKGVISRIDSEEKEENATSNNFNKGAKDEKCDNEASHEILHGNNQASEFGSSEKQRIQILENEIIHLRKIISEYKRKEIDENESMLKLEIVNLRNTVSAKVSENQLLQNENNNLKSHVKMLQENIETYFSGVNKNNYTNAVETQEPHRVETEVKQEEKVAEDLSNQDKYIKQEHKNDNTEKNSTIFDSDATRNTNVLSDSNISSTIFKSNTTQNTTLDSSSSNKNKIPESTQKKRATPTVMNPPPLFKMHNKNAIGFNNPSALFENSSSESTGKSTGLFD